MRRPPSSRPARLEESEVGGLAGIVGHELNNIAVPLEGFAELALQGTAAEESARALYEMRIVIGRIKSLASDLESLAESGSSPQHIAIGDCMPEPGTDSLVARNIDWRCNAATPVMADREHARRAIRSLGAIAARIAAHPASAPMWSVWRGSMPARCIACGAGPLDNPFVHVQVFSSRPIAAGLHNPLAAKTGWASRRLALAVLVHSAHCADGHIVLDEGSGLVSVVLPAPA